jgi:carbon monoxide dehydrogenase subunit G
MSSGSHPTVMAVCVALALATVSSGMADARGDAVPQVSVRDNGGVYGVTAQFEVPQPAAVALEVLTDYERIPRFMPDVKSSIVRERSADRIVVEQEAVARVMLFSKRIHLRLDVRTSDGTISFRDTSGRSFSKYEGSWRVTEQDGRTIVRYDLRAQPVFDIPAFLLTRLLKRDANQMIERLRAEIAARAGRGSGQ